MNSIPDGTGKTFSPEILLATLLSRASFHIFTWKPGSKSMMVIMPSVVRGHPVCRSEVLDVEDWQGMIHPQDRPLVARTLLSLGGKAQGPDTAPCVLEYRIRHQADDRWLWVEDCWQKFPGDEHWYVGIQRDVHEQKQLKMALAESARKIALLNAVTRHDILNQISVIEAVRVMIKEELLQMNIEAREFLEEIFVAAGQIKRQISFTGDYEALGRSDPAWQEISLLIRSLPAMPLRGRRIISNLPPGLEIYADHMLEKVFYNLIDNALRHGGRVKTIGITFHEDGGAGILVVEDDGVGIEPELKDQIFERGFGSNSGYGLFLSREILAITGLSIRETGTVKKGARFEILLPADTWRLPEQSGILK